MMKLSAKLFVLLFILVSCEAPSGGEEATKNVTVNTRNVTNPIEIVFDGNVVGAELNLDEYELDTDEVKLLFTIKNNTAFPITDIDVEFTVVEETDRAYNFSTDEESGDIVFPGMNGTCTKVLYAGNTCTIELAIKTATEKGSRVYKQNVFFKFKNIVDADGQNVMLEVLAGFPASLNFQNSETTFHFGEFAGIANPVPVVERAEKVLFHQHLTITNDGDLRARNLVVSLPDVTCNAAAVEANCNTLSVNFQQKYLFDAWELTHNCPLSLKSGESCEADVYFESLNQNPDSGPVPEEIKELDYAVTAKAAYKKNPSFEDGQLNGYFRVISTTIAAALESSVEVSEFDVEIISGNRDKKSFIIENKGYRHGVFRKFIFTDNNTSAHLATCVDTGIAGGYLECFDAALANPTELKDFPFFVNDTNGCFEPLGADPATYIDVDSGCIFDIYFQPSIQHDTAREYDIALDVEYDNRWKGQEFIVDNYMFQTLAKSITPAKIQLTKIKFGTGDCDDGLMCSITQDGGGLPLDLVQYNAQYDGGSVYEGCYDGLNQVLHADISEKKCLEEFKFNLYREFDLFRMALISKNYVTRQKITLTFQNNGGSDAYSTQFFTDYLDLDGDHARTGVEFFDENTLSNIGTDAAYPYFKDLQFSSTDCGVVVEGALCNVTMEFAAIGLPAQGECGQAKSMFSNETLGGNELSAGVDCIASDTFGPSEQIAKDMYKLFSMTYDDQSHYTDTNLYTTVDDIPNRVVDAKLKAVIVAKGKLEPLDADHKGGILLAHDAVGERHLIIRNIGTGTIPYIGFAGGSENMDSKWNMHPSSIFNDNSLDVVAVAPGELSAYGADYDCAKLFDFTGADDPSITGIDSRKDVSITDSTTDPVKLFTKWHGGLPAEKTCVYKVRFGRSRKNFTSLQSFIDDNLIDLSKPELDSYNQLLLINPFDYTMTEIDGGVYNIKGFADTSWPADLGLAYYDGDADVSLAETPPHSYGGRYNALNSNLSHVAFHFREQISAEPVIIGIAPMISAFAYREAVSIDTIAHPNGTSPDIIKSTDLLSFPSVWFWNTGMVQKAVDSTSGLNDYTNYYQGYKAAQNVLYSAGAQTDILTHPYALDFGTFPVSTTVKVSFNITMPLETSARIIHEAIVEDGGTNAFSFVSIKADSSDYLTAMDMDSATTRLRKLNFNGSTEQAYAGTYSATYTTNNNVDKACIDQIQTENGDTACTKEQFTFTARLHARTIASIADISFEDENCAVDFDPFNMISSCSTWDAPVASAVSINNQGAITDPVIEFTAIKLDIPSSDTAYSSSYYYVRKRIHIKNDTSVPMNNFSLGYKKLLSAIEPLDFSKIDRRIFNDFSDCSDEVAAKTLAANSSCYLDIVYQPNNESSLSEFYIYTMYEVAADQYVHKSKLVTFTPKEPAKVIAETATNSDLSTGLFPWYFPDGADQNDPDQMQPLTNSPYGILITQGGGNFVLENAGMEIFVKTVDLSNTSTTMASFNKAYQSFIGSVDKTSTPSYPGDFVSVNGIMGTQVLHDTRASFAEVKVFLTQGCFLGDDDAGLTVYQKGFNDTTVEPCQMQIVLYPNVNISGKKIDETNVTGANFQIEYFDNDRLTYNFLEFYFTGTFLPNPVFANDFAGGNYFENVEADDSGSVSFSWNTMTEDDMALGAITGYRVFYTDSASPLSAKNVAVLKSVANELNTYVDVPASTTEITIGGFFPGMYKYFRVVAIRANAAYTENVFPDLIGEYLSDSDIDYLELVVPPLDHYYDHGSFRVYDKQITITGMFNYDEAVASCPLETLAIYKGFTPMFKYMEMIDEEAMDFLRLTPAANDYDSGTSYGSSMHWIAGTKVTPDGWRHSSVTGYINTEQKQDLVDSLGYNYHYYRDGSDGSENFGNGLRMFYGRYAPSMPLGSIGLAPSGTQFKLGKARCMVQL